jgi:hypothetical protein
MLQWPLVFLSRLEYPWQAPVKFIKDHQPALFGNRSIHRAIIINVDRDHGTSDLSNGFLMGALHPKGDLGQSSRKLTPIILGKVASVEEPLVTTIAHLLPTSCLIYSSPEARGTVGAADKHRLVLGADHSEGQKQTVNRFNPNFFFSLARDHHRQVLHLPDLIRGVLVRHYKSLVGGGF